MSYKGIDISNCDGNINFDEVKKEGIEIIIIKATEGVNFIDSYLNKNYEASKDKFNIGFYHFFSEKTDPEEQAKDFYNSIKDKKFNIIPCLDIETNNLNRSSKEVSDRCISFLEKFKELSGYDCMIYSGAYFSRDILDSRIKNKYSLWVAEYGVNKPIDTGFKKVVGWQYSETGSINGINSKVDLDVFYDGIFINPGIKKVAPTPGTTKAFYLSFIQGQEVKNLQKELNKQFNSGLAIDGLFGLNTLNACPIIREGAKGNITKLIQARLLNRGYTSLKPTGTDGIFGSATEQAIKNLQKNKNINIDGIVGKDTWKALYSKQ